MVEAGIGWVTLFVVVSALSALGLLADEWGADTRDELRDVVDRSECH